MGTSSVLCGASQVECGQDGAKLVGEPPLPPPGQSYWSIPCSEQCLQIVLYNLYAIVKASNHNVIPFSGNVSQMNECTCHPLAICMSGTVPVTHVIKVS